MNYQVLARKWRPQRFTEVVGQQHVLTALVNALAQGRLHHAYLFSGTRGVGKTSIARLLAKALNCEQGITSEPCGTCSSCLEIEQGRFVDLLEIDAASRTKVEDTRELLDNVQYQPARGRFKVYLIDEVHMLSRHSFNALLKTLEEPPPHVKFLLATTDPQKLPITILSRCLQFHLKSLSAEQIDGQLQHILSHEQLPFEDQATAALARAADGSVRDALSLTDQALAFGNGEIKLAQVESMLGNLNHNQLMKLVNALLGGDGAAMLAQVAELASMGPDYDQILREMVGFWHQLALAQVVPAQPSLPFASELNRLAPLVSAEHIQLYYQICVQGRKDLPFAADGRGALEMTLLRALAFNPTAAVADSTINTAERSTGHSAPSTYQQGELESVKKSEPPRNTQVDAASLTVSNMPQREAEHALSAEVDNLSAAELYQEQDTILAQAAKLGHTATPVSEVVASPVSAAQSSASQVSTSQISGSQISALQTSSSPPSESKNEAPNTSATQISGAPACPAQIDDSQALPASEAPLTLTPMNTSAPSATPASQPPSQLAAPAQGEADIAPSDTAKINTPPKEADSGEVVDVAAANVAQIRRLLQTRNRLRSQEPPAPAAPVNKAPVNKAPVPASSKASLTEPDRTKQSSHHNVIVQPSAARSMRAASPELPPLDAYTDMADQSEDDAPPWLADDSALLNPRPAASVVPARSEEQTSARGAAAQSALSSVTPPMAAPSFSPSLGAAAQAPGDPEPIKPSSLLVKATDPWALLVAQLSLGGLLRQLAMHSSLGKQDAHHWILWLKPAHKHLLNDNNGAELAKLLSSHLQTPIQITLQLGEQDGHLTPAEIEQQLYQAAIATAKDEIEADDAVQFLITRFAAELDRDSIEPMAH